MFWKSDKKAKESKKTPALSSALMATIHQAIGPNIPPMPGPAQQAFQLSIDPKAEAQDFIGVIEADEALSARTIKVANSVYFDRGKRSESIQEAVLVIGINELRCLLNATTLFEIFPSRHKARIHLWAHDVATALISRLIAQRTMPSKSETAFLGGLMHDIGKLLLLQRNPEAYGSVLRLVEAGALFVQAEEEVFGFNHCQLGRLIGERWHFSPELIEVVANHHHPWSEEELASKNTNLTAIVKSADIIANALALGMPKQLDKLRVWGQESLAQVWQVIALAAHERDGFLNNCRKVFELEFDLYSGKVQGGG